MAKIVTINCLVVLLGQMISCIVGEANPDILETTIITENNEAIALKWVQTEQFLANENLPIWTTTNKRYHLLKENDIMEEIGTFKIYHDLEKSSAIVLIEKWNCIFGTIDVRYSIACLPLDRLSDQQYKIGETEYISIMNNHDFPDHDKPLDLSQTARSPNTPHESTDEYKMLIKTYFNPYELSHNSPHCEIAEHDSTIHRPSTSSVGPPPNKRPRVHSRYTEEVIAVYPEILIFISHEVVSSTEHLSTLVLRYIVYLNAVAMLFAKLATHNVKIHINIAGIVIDKHGDGFTTAELFANNRPEGKAVLRSLQNFIDMATNVVDYQQSFPVDSFDMFLYSTTNEWRERAIYPGGISTDLFDIRASRVMQRKMPKLKDKYLGSIVDNTNLMQHYVNAAREIAHLMTVEDDPPNLDLCLHGPQCHAIMQTGNQHCANCLTWSHASVKGFKKYLSTYMNRCYLRNLPRSLHPYGVPIKTLVPADQCLCFGYSPDLKAVTHLNNMNRVKTHICKRMMRCSSSVDGSIIPSFAYPIDGTPCDENDDNKVCWNNKCITTEVLT